MILHDSRAENAKFNGYLAGVTSLIRFFHSAIIFQLFYCPIDWTVSNGPRSHINNPANDFLSIFDRVFVVNPCVTSLTWKRTFFYVFFSAHQLLTLGAVMIKFEFQLNPMLTIERTLGAFFSNRWKRHVRCAHNVPHQLARKRFVAST